jgi:hypothetical protein
MRDACGGDFGLSLTAWSRGRGKMSWVDQPRNQRPFVPPYGDEWIQYIIKPLRFPVATIVKLRRGKSDAQDKAGRVQDLMALMFRSGTGARTPVLSVAGGNMSTA